MTQYGSSAFWQQRLIKQRVCQKTCKAITNERKTDKPVVIAILSVYSQMMTYRAAKANS